MTTIPDIVAEALAERPTFVKAYRHGDEQHLGKLIGHALHIAYQKYRLNPNHRQVMDEVVVQLCVDMRA